MKKAIFFPGTGYTCREELFLLTGRELEKKGWTIVPIDWSVIPFKPVKTVKEAGDIALGYAICVLKDEKLDDCDEVLFVSKSLGCISSLKYSSLMNLKSRHVLLTPTREALEKLSSWVDVACAVIGSADSLMSIDELSSYIRTHGFPVMIVPGIGHSLKYDDPHTTEKLTSDITAYMMRMICNEAE